MLVRHSVGVCIAFVRVLCLSIYLYTDISLHMPAYLSPYAE